MDFLNFFDAWNFVIIGTLLISIIMGFVVQKANFCTMGAIGDIVTFGSYERLRAWFMAIAIAMFSIALLEHSGVITLADTYPNYRSTTIPWGTAVLGGLIFGFAMTYAGGCGQKTLINVGNGNVSSLIVMIAMATTAYYMVMPLPNTDMTLYELIVTPWSSTPFLNISLNHQSDLGAIALNALGEENQDFVRWYRLAIGMVLSLSIFYWVFKSKIDFDYMFSGIVVGLGVVGLWVITSIPTVNYDDEAYSLKSFMSEWDMLYEQKEGEPEVEDIDSLKPKNSQNSFSPQSFTFVNPMGQSYGLIANGYDVLSSEIKSDNNDSNNSILDKVSTLKPLLSVAVIPVLGIILGSFLSSILFKSFKLNYNFSLKNIVTKVVSGIAMGFGGVLALGCTVGQGITGTSTLSVTSFIALFGIIVGAVMAQKIMYFFLMRED